MRKALLPLPEIALIAGTRGLLGAGIGLLLAPKISNEARTAAGWTLLVGGALSTIPLAVDLLRNRI
jgi:hypothetical protein